MPAQIPFTRGVPSADLLPVEDLRAAAARIFEGDASAALAYAPGGFAPLRRLSTETYIAPNTLAEAVVAAYCTAGAFEPNVARAVAELRRRRDAMEEAL